MNLPNVITIARICSVPVFVGFAFADSDAAAIAAFVIFLAASLSDLVDGYLARRWAISSKFGAFMDPLADKLLVGAALVALVATRSFPWWAAVIIGVREVAVSLLRVRIAREGGSLPASSTAKAKTFVQIVMVCWWLYPWDISIVHNMLVGAALAVTLWSWWEYVRTGPVEATR